MFARFAQELVIDLGRLIWIKPVLFGSPRSINRKKPLADFFRGEPLDPEFSGFGRAGTDDAGVYWFETIKPGPVPFSGEQMQAPHVSVTVHARGMLNHAQTRLYFEDEPANESDPVLALVPADRRPTLIARREGSDGALVYRLDIVLQGRGETVFFNI